MKKIAFAIILLTLTAISLTGCSTRESRIELGSTAFTIELPDGYEAVEDAWADYQVGYYFKDDESVDFDVYQWRSDGRSLADEAKLEAEAFGTQPSAMKVGDIDGMTYVSSEEYEGVSYTVVNYIFLDKNTFIELCFWTDGTSQQIKAAEDIVNTLKKQEK